MTKKNKEDRVDIWMPIYPSDYLMATLDLSTEEHGIYFMLMLYYWKRGGPIPDNFQKLLAVVKLPPEREDSLREILDVYFSHDERARVYRQKRIDAELRAAENKRKIAQKNGLKGGRPPLDPAKRKPAPKPFESDPEPKPKPTAKTDEEFEQFWEVYSNKVGKIDALKAWKQMAKNRPPIGAIVAKVEALNKTRKWTKDDGDFIPKPATWLRAGGWDDQVGPAAAKAPTGGRMNFDL